MSVSRASGTPCGSVFGRFCVFVPHCRMSSMQNGSLWVRFGLGVTLGSFLAYGWTLKPYLSQFDVEKLEMASVMGICAGLLEPKSENVEKVMVFKAFLEGSRGPRVRQDCEQLSEPRGLGGGRGRVNPPPRRLVWRFWEVWRVWNLVSASTRLEARSLGGLRRTHFSDVFCLSKKP